MNCWKKKRPRTTAFLTPGILTTHLLSLHSSHNPHVPSGTHHIPRPLLACVRSAEIPIRHPLAKQSTANWSRFLPALSADITRIQDCGSHHAPFSVFRYPKSICLSCCSLLETRCDVGPACTSLSTSVLHFRILPVGFSAVNEAKFWWKGVCLWPTL